MKIKKWDNFLNEEVWSDEPIDRKNPIIEEPSLNEPTEDYITRKDYRKGILDCWEICRNYLADLLDTEKIEDIQDDVMELANVPLKESLSNLQKEYREFFRYMLDIYEVSSPTKLSEEKKKEFFDNIKKYWVKGKGVTKELDKIKEDILGKEPDHKHYKHYKKEK